MPKHIRGGMSGATSAESKVAGVRLDPLPPGTIGQGNNGKKGNKNKGGSSSPRALRSFLRNFLSTILVVLKQKST